MTMTSDERAPETAQPELELPDDHGRRPSMMRVRFTGTGTPNVGSHVGGERVVFIIEAVRGDAAHKQTKKLGLVYDESFAIESCYEAAPEDGRDLLVGLRQLYRAADDARHGRTPLFNGRAPSRVVWADANGYVLSEEDLADIRGEDPPPPSDEELAAAEDVEAHEQLVAPQWLRAVEDGDTEGYDRLKVPQIMAAVKVVGERSAVIACAKYEAAEKNRAGLRKAFDARLAELAEPAE